MGLEGWCGRENGAQEERTHEEGLYKHFPPLSLSGLLALLLRQEQPNRWKGFAVVGIRNPTAQGSKPSLSVCLPLLLRVLWASAQKKVKQK